MNFCKLNKYREFERISFEKKGSFVTKFDTNFCSNSVRFVKKKKTEI